MWKKLTMLIISAVLVASLAGCADKGLGGKTLYYISPFDGEKTTIVFNEDNSWHMTEGTSEVTGTWNMEENNVVLTTSNGWATITLTPTEDGWQELNGDEWERYYLTEEAAEESAEEYIDSAPERVQAILEGNEWEWLTTNRDYYHVMASVSFSEGKATYRTPEYKSSVNVISDDEEDWRDEDHDGTYSIVVEEMTSGSYSGTIEIDGKSTHFYLKGVGSKYVYLYLNNYEFEATV